MRTELLSFGFAVLFTGCAGLPAQQAPVPSVAAAPPSETMHATQVFVYPSRDHSAEQLDTVAPAPAMEKRAGYFRAMTARLECRGYGVE